jgi:hypothetical protein
MVTARAGVDFEKRDIYLTQPCLDRAQRSSASASMDVTKVARMRGIRRLRGEASPLNRVSDEETAISTIQRYRRPCGRHGGLGTQGWQAE